MKKIKIIVCALMLVSSVILVGCQAEPVTTTIIQTETNTLVQTITAVQTTTATKTEIKTITSTVSDTPKTTTSTSSTSKTSTQTSTVTQTTQLGEVMSSDGQFRLGPTQIYEAFGGVMITGTVYNLGTEKVNVDVTITCYDAKGAVFGTATTTVYSLEPGVEGTYKINCTVPFIGVYSYSLDAVAK
jgi:hypothetical protein